MMIVIIMIFMLMAFVPTMMTKAEEVLGMLEGVMTVITVANKVFTNKVFSIHQNNNNNNQQSSKDIFMKEDEDEIEEEGVSCFDSLHSSTTTMNHHR